MSVKLPISNHFHIVAREVGCENSLLPRTEDERLASYFRTFLHIHPTTALWYTLKNAVHIGVRRGGRKSSLFSRTDDER